MGRSLNGLRFLAGGRGRRASTVSVLLIVLGLASSVVGGGVAAASPAKKADMAVLSVSDNPDPVFTGQTVTYTVSVGNRGPSQATGVTLTTTLPPGVLFVPNEFSPNCTEASGVVTCSWSSFPTNVATQILITVTPSTAGALQLTFTVTAAEREMSDNDERHRHSEGVGKCPEVVRVGRQDGATMADRGDDDGRVHHVRGAG